jgi:hypothetical protein
MLLLGVTLDMCRCRWLFASLPYMLEMWKDAVMEEYFVYLMYVAAYKQGV